MSLKSFTDLFTSKTSHGSETEMPDQHHIDEFHRLHAELEHHAKHLDKRGYHIDIDYHSPHPARHGRNSSTLFFNQALRSKKTITIDKSAIAVDRSKPTKSI